MRLIDADALMADCQLAQKQADRHGREFANAFYSGGGEISTEWWCVEDMIENAPTIEPERKTGKWIKHAIGHEHTPWGFDCSECGEWFVVGEEVIKKYKYCPNCGSYNGGNSHEGTDKG